MLSVLLLCPVVMIVNISVVVLIRAEKKTSTNRYSITKHISCLEVFIVCTHVVISLCEESMSTPHSSRLRSVEYICFGTLYYLVYLTLVTDRLLEVYLNIKYPVYITGGQFYFAASLYWMISVFLGIAVGLTDDSKLKNIGEIFMTFIYPASDAFSIIFTTSVYTYIFWRCSKNTIIPDYMKRQYTRKIRNRTYFRALLIFLTTITSLLPMACFIFYGEVKAQMVLCFAILFLRDGILHIILQEHVREHVHNFLKRNKVLPGQEDIFTLSCANKTLELRQKIRNKNRTLVSKDILPF